MQVDYYKMLAKVCQDSYFEFVKRFWHTVSREPLVANWHFPYLCGEIQTSMERVMRGEPCPHDTVVNISPGTSKSTLFSIFLLPWAWTINPGMKMIGASFTESLAFDLSSKTRQVVTSPLYQKCWPHIRIRPDVNNKGHWENTLLGARFAVGVGGDVIGRHAHVIVIDDPLNPQGARSKADIEKSGIWCKETIPTRKVNKEAAWTALVMQRLSVEDPTALYLSRPNVKHICLPGELTSDVYPPELASNYVDGLFDPVRLSRASLDKMKADMGTYGYAGQILQTPIPPGGGMFDPEKIQKHTIAPDMSEFSRVVRFWDRACLSPDTQVLMANGSVKRIDTVVPGDWVATPKGKAIVAKAFVSTTTYDVTTVLFSDGTEVTGTPDHKLLTINGKWVQLDSVSDGDLFESVIKVDQCEPETHYWKPLSLTEKRTPGRRIEGTSQETRLLQVSKQKDRSTETSGSTTTAAYPQAIIYTTLTGTTITTTSTILNAWPLKTTSKDTPTSISRGLHYRIKTIAKRHWRLFVRPPQKEKKTQHTRKSGEHTALKRWALPVFQGSLPASNAASNARRDGQGLLCTVPQRVDRELGIRRKAARPIKWLSSAKYAAATLSGTAGLPHARRSVEQLSEIGPAVMWDLEIQNDAGEHTFVANGKWVHNCTHNAGDFTAGVKMGLHKDGSFWVLDMVRGQWSTDARENIILNTAKKDGITVRVGIEREPGSAGIDSANATIKRLAGYIVYAEPATGSKEVRADTFSVQVNSGNVHTCLQGKPLQDLIEELRHFPLGKHDDQVDACSGAFASLANKKPKLGVFK